MVKRRQVLTALAAALMAAATPSWAQTFPTKTVRIVVPLPPGSPPDVLARLIAERVHEAWKQPVVVENRPGATGMIGMDAVAKSAPDGHTVGIMFMTHTVLPGLFGTVPYDTLADLAPIANLVWLYNALVVPPSMPVRTTREFVEAARAQPGKLSYASGGNGSPAHLLGESFREVAGVDLLHVPFRGPADAVQNLIGGHVSAMFATTSVAVPMVRTARLRALAVTSAKRLAAMPDVPTLAESGVTGFQIREWEGIVAPARTPRPIIDKWNAELARIMARPDMRAKLADLGMEPADANSPEEFAGLVREQLQYWTRFVQDKNLKVN